AASRCLWNESLPPEVDIRDGATSLPEHVTPLSRSAPGGFLCAPARNTQDARKSADFIIRLRGHSPPFPAGRLFSSGPREGSKTHEFACDWYRRVTPHGWHFLSLWNSAARPTYGAAFSVSLAGTTSFPTELGLYRAKRPW